MVAAASRPGSRLTLRQVGLNKTRNAVISALQRMGARMDIVPTSPGDAGEPYGDITVYGSDSLHGISLLPEEIPNLIDEIPILAVAGALGRGDFIVPPFRRSLHRGWTYRRNLRAGSPRRP